MRISHDPNKSVENESNHWTRYWCLESLWISQAKDVIDIAKKILSEKKEEHSVGLQPTTQ